MYHKVLFWNNDPTPWKLEGIITGDSDPTSDVEGNLGQFYYNTSTGIYFKCTYSEGGVYSWEEFSTTAFDEVVFDEETRMLHFYKDGEDVVDPVSIPGGGGGGGGGNNAILTVTNMTGWLAKTLSVGSDCRLSIDWSSLEQETPTGAGILTVRVNNIVRQIIDVSQGLVSVNITDLISVGTNNVKLTVTDVYENAKSINFTITCVELRIASSFSTIGEFTAGEPITYTYTPYGSLVKTVHFMVDGTEIGTQTVTTSGRQQTYNLPAMTHGSHSLAVWFTASIDGDDVPSNVLYYDLIVVGDSSLPIIASSFRLSTAEQYTTLNIPIRVYTPDRLTSDISLYNGADKVADLTVDRTEYIWSIRMDTYGAVALGVRCGAVTRLFELTITESEIHADAEEDSLALHLSSAGRSNNEEHPEIWRDEEREIECTLSGFNFVSDGWVLDSDGVTVLRTAGGGRVTIPYKPFERDFRVTGKTLEIEFATRDILDYDAVVVSCMSGGRGFELTAQMARLVSEASEIYTQYKEDEHVRIAFVAEKRNEHRLLMIYINGIMSGVVQYPEDDDFSQQDPVPIVIGSNACTTDLYCIRIYDNDLTRFQIVNNWIADTQDIATMLYRYRHNNVYDAYGSVVIEQLPNDLPYLVLHGAELPQYKGDKKDVSGYYVDPENPERSFSFTGAQIDVQGTSSQYYPRKNYKIKFQNGFVMTASGETVSKYKLRSDSIPTDTFTFKADVASSESANNVVLARLYENACPYRTPAQVENQSVRQGIDGLPSVIFWDNGTATSFIGKYNFNNDKGTEEVFGFTEGDESWETLNNTSDRVIWKNDDYSGTDWLNDFEARFPDLDPPYTDPEQLSSFAAWVKSTDRTQATGNALPAPVTYGETTYTNDTADYRLAKFRAEAGQYVELSSSEFYYLFTELFLMVDSRAKNSFPSFIGTPVFGGDV